MSRFDYVKFDTLTEAKSLAFKSLVTDLEEKIEQHIQCPRAKEYALKSLEETFMWVGKGLRNDLIKKNPTQPLQEERKNG